MKHCYNFLSINDDLRQEAVPEIFYQPQPCDGLQECVPADRFHGMPVDVSDCFPADSTGCMPAGMATAEISYYVQRLRSALPPSKDYLCRHVPGGVQVWCRCGAGEDFEDVSRADDQVSCFAQSYLRFTLRIQAGPEAGRLVLVVSCDGSGYVLRECLRELLCRHPDTRIFRMALYGGIISNWSHLSLDARYNPEELYPLLNPAVSRWLDIPFPKVKGDDISILNRRICRFIEIFCNNGSLLAAIPHNGHLEPADAALGCFPPPQLQFGKGGLHTSPAEGLQLYGPAQRPPGSHFQCFFIYFEPDARYAEVFLNRLTGKNGICFLSRLPVTCNSSLNIVLEPGQDALSQAERQLKAFYIDPEVRHVAFYFTPCQCGGNNNSSRRLYSRLKEILQHLRVALLEVGYDMTDTGSLAALAAGTINRLGGQSWVLAGAGESDLVAGVACCADPGLAVAAACFTGNGMFLGSDLTKGGDRASVAGVILEKFFNRPGFQRIVIHYFDHGSAGSPEVPEWFPDELYPGIPVVGVGISRHREGGIMLLGDSPYPAPGMWARTGSHDWLLVTSSCVSGSCQPLNLHFTCNSPGYLDGEGITAGLLSQVYSFCYLRWGKGMALPVTLRIKKTFTD
jgi:hypothetical protein